MDKLRPDPSPAAANAEGGCPLSPAELAGQAAMLMARESPIRSGDLPMWTRLATDGRSTWWSRSLWILGWCATLALLLAALLRVFYHDGATVLIWINAFTAYIYLPAYAILAAALWKRRWMLAVVCGAVVALHLTWIAPDFAPATPYPTTTADASQTVRVFYANVLASSGDYQAVLDEIAAADPDVIVLAEYRQPRVPTMQASPLMDQYKYGNDLDARYAGEVAVFSRLPVSRQQLTYAAGRVVNIVDIPLGDKRLRVVALHSHRPIIEEPDMYAAYWAEVERLVAEQEGPLLVIGDFNATQHSTVYERLTAGRLRSAHVDRGRGYVTTWPNGRWPLPPIRIDHAFLSPEVECLAIAEGVGSGSDHKPLILDIRVHDTQPGESASMSARSGITASE